MSIHYNPAGLSLLPEGKMISQGVTVPWVKKTSRFKINEDFEGFLEGEFTPREDDPIFEGDTRAEGTNSAGRMYVPVLDRTLDFLVAPSFGISYRKPGSKWTFALGHYVPFAVGLVHGDANDPARWGGKAVYQQHLVYASPAVSCQLTDNLSWGLSVGLGQTAMGAEVDMRNPNDMVALTRVLGEATEGMQIPPITQLYYDDPWFYGGISPYDKVASLKMDLRSDFSPNYNLGLLYEPWEWLGLGLVYQSPIKARLHGAFRIKYSEVWQKFIDWHSKGPYGVRRIAAMLDIPTNAVPSQSGVVTTEVEFPQRVQFGIRLSPWERLNLMFDLKWSEWSVLDQHEFHFDQDIQLLQVAKILGYTGGDRTLIVERDFQDTLDWSAGMELSVTDWLDLRLGYEWRDSPVQKEHYDLLMAIPDMHVFSGGGGIHLGNDVSIDIGGSYMYNRSYKVGKDESDNLTSTDWTDIVYNPYAGLDYEQETYTYMGSVTVNMPFEVMQSALHHQKEIVTDTLSFLNPFS